MALPDFSGVGWCVRGSWGALLGSGVRGTNGAIVVIGTPFRLRDAKMYNGGILCECSDLHSICNK